MFIDGLTTADSLPVLEAAAKFSARRQELLTFNIANISTPDFRPKTVSTEAFQQQLGEAIDKKRKASGAAAQDLPLQSTSEVQVTPTAGGGFDLQLNPSTSSGNILFHDRNNRDVERMMAELAENTANFRVATELFRSRIDMLRSVIAERV
ncbi:MAG: flagellar basal body rod protein FlgB [Phycisphaerales bacterium]|nr:flagellar basal body rod protein FlgB [Phycisphaerales bacterium]